MRVLTGDETGLVKAVDVEAKRIVVLGQQTRKRAIKAMTWTDAQPGAFAVARADKVVALWQDGKVPQVVREISGVGGEDVVGLSGVTKSAVLVGHGDGKMEWCPLAAEGVVQRWSVRGPLTCMAVNEQQVAVGGKERDLALFDLEKVDVAAEGGESAPLWEAKNVKHDKLDLRQPVWVTACAFMGSPHVLAVGTAYKQLRIYDVRAQRRPVRSLELENKDMEGHRVTALTGGADVCHEVVVGDAAGTVIKVDTRSPMAMTGRLEGPAGSVRALVRHRSLPVVALGGLDRMVRVFELQKQGVGRSGRKESHKFYLKQRLNAVLLADEGRVVMRGNKKEEQHQDEDEGGLLEEEQLEGLDDDVQSMSEDEEEEEEEEEEAEEEEEGKRGRAKERKLTIERIRGHENGRAKRPKEDEDEDEEQEEEEEEEEDDDEGGELELNVMGMHEEEEEDSEDGEEEEEAESDDDDEEEEEEEEEESSEEEEKPRGKKSTQPQAQPRKAPQAKRAKH